MTLTLETGPFGHHPGGQFNFEPPAAVIYFEDFPRRIRARFAGETVADSTRLKLLHESGHLPVYYFPEADVRMDLLSRSDHTSICPGKGTARYFTVTVGEHQARNAAWSYPEPIAACPPLHGHIAFYWAAMDEWLEEDEQALGHARDPYHRIDVLDTSRHVRVSVAGDVVAESRRARVLYETGLPPRWYLPLEDVHREVLVRSDTRTRCAYKGYASYYSVRVGEVIEKDLVWFYSEPRHDALRVKDYVCFFNERVDLELDGEPVPRPRTLWSPDAGPRRERFLMATRWPG